MNRRNLLPLALLVPLDAPARAVVTQAAQAARGFGTARITIQGYGGPVGGAGFNRALADARSRHVAELLHEAGVPAEMAPIEARRVDLRIAAP